MPDFKTATIIKHTNPASTYHVYKVATQEEFTFKPGQYVSVKVADAKINSYSIASMPRGNQFELIIDVKPGHEGSYFFKEIREGEQIKFLGPFGVFTLKEDEANELLFMATGSGISPIKSMLEHLIFQKKDPRKMRLYFGLRHCSDVFMHQYFKEMDRDYDSFTFIPCLSKPDNSWNGQCGHITELIKQDYRDKDNKNISAYMCGNGSMIDEGKNTLASLGFLSKQIYHEKFF